MFKSFKKLSVFIILAGLTVIVLSSCSVSVSKPAVLPKGDYSGLKTYMSQFINDRMNKNNIAGVSIALIDDQNVIWSEGFGYSDKEKNIKVTTDTLFRVGSVSKTFTGLSIMQLAEKGLIDIDSPLKKYVPDFSIIDTFKDSQPITIRNIMSHHSGLPSDILLDWESERPFEDVASMFKDLYRAYPADYNFSYSNAGISTLGITVQNVSGLKFEDYTQKNIFQPLNMNHSGFYLRNDMKEYYSKSYDKDGKPADDMLIRDVPAGTVITSANDAANYLKMYLNNGNFNNRQIISKDSLDKMWTIQNKNNELDFGINLGLTWFIREDKTYGRFVSHGGDTRLFHTMLILNPELKLGAIVMTNSEKGESVAGEIAKELIDTACEIKTGIKRTDSSKTELKNINVPQKELKAEEGTYSGYIGIAKIKAGDNKLEINAFGNNFELYKKDDNLFHPVVKILGLIPLNIPELEYMTADFKTINNQKILILSTLMGGEKVSIGLKKIEPLNPANPWFNRTGTYKSKGKNILFNSFNLINSDGYLVIEGYMDGKKTVSYALEPENDTQARTAGVGRNFNEMIEIKSENGIDYIYYSGIKFYKEVNKK